jgi:hypothetical protein
MHYPGRQYVYAEDAVASLLGGAKGSRSSRGLLRQSADLLANSLGKLEDRLCEPDEDGVWECASAIGLRPKAWGADDQIDYLVIPPVTSADLRAFAADPAQEADQESLRELSDDVESIAAAVGFELPPMPAFFAPGGLPPLPDQVVHVTDDEGILTLEAGVTPYVTSLEDLHAALATRLGLVASSIDDALARGPRSSSAWHMS